MSQNVSFPSQTTIQTSFDNAELEINESGSSNTMESERIQTVFQVRFNPPTIEDTASNLTDRVIASGETQKMSINFLTGASLGKRDSTQEETPILSEMVAQEKKKMRVEKTSSQEDISSLFEMMKLQQKKIEALTETLNQVKAFRVQQNVILEKLLQESQENIPPQNVGSLPASQSGFANRNVYFRREYHIFPEYPAIPYELQQKRNCITTQLKAMISNQKFSDAAYLCENILKEKENADWKYIKIARIYYGLCINKNYKQALAQMDSILDEQLNEDDTYFAWIVKGHCYFKLNETTKAIDVLGQIPKYSQWFEKALNIAQIFSKK
jgi:hypothetical protein